MDVKNYATLRMVNGIADRRAQLMTSFHGSHTNPENLQIQINLGFIKMYNAIKVIKRCNFIYLTRLYWLCIFNNTISYCF